MVSVVIETLVVGLPPSPSIIVLRPKASEGPHTRVLPIWIGPTEAAAIGIALDGPPRHRPMTHDFLVNVLGSLHIDIDHIIIDRVEGSTFFATVALNQGGKSVNVDARPSDSIALAVRTKAPLYVSEDVLNSSSFPYIFGNQANRELEMEQFKGFLDSLSPEDFQLQE